MKRVDARRRGGIRNENEEGLPLSTSAISTEPPSPLLAAVGFLRRFTIDEYHRMIPAGILMEGDPVELLEGYVVNKWENLTAAPPSLLSISGFRKYTVAEYHKMLDFGILAEGEPVELIEGYVVNKMGRNAPHETSLRRLMNFLPILIPVVWSSQYQCAVWFAESEPEPDGVVLRGPLADFDGRVPGPSDVAIEVSDSSLLFDRREKGRTYARANIPVYWIVNVADRQSEVYTDPDATANPPAYRGRADYRPDDNLPITLDGIQTAAIPVNDLVP